MIYFQLWTLIKIFFSVLLSDLAIISDLNNQWLQWSLYFEVSTFTLGIIRDVEVLVLVLVHQIVIHYSKKKVTRFQSALQSTLHFISIRIIFVNKYLSQYKYLWDLSKFLEFFRLFEKVFDKWKTRKYLLDSFNQMLFWE